GARSGCRTHSEAAHMTFPDTNILGSFARLGALDLLLELFGRDKMTIVPAVYAELVAGIREGRQFLRPVIELVEKGELELIPLSAEEVVERQKLPATLNNGEAESITVCLSQSAAFLTNDKHARNFARSVGIEVFDLVEVLRSLWKLDVCSKR